MWRKSFTFMFLDAETHHRRMFGAVLCVTAFTDLNFPLGNDIQLIFSLYPGTRTLKNWITFQRNVFIHRMPTGKLWNQAFLHIVSHSKLDIYSKECPAKWIPLLGVIIGSFNIDNGNGSENATFRVNSLFFQFAENWCPPYVLHKGYNVCYTGRFAATIFSTTRGCIIVATLFRMVATLFHVAIKIVVANRFV